VALDETLAAHIAASVFGGARQRVVPAYSASLTGGPH
jgi:hypothetical protein